MEEDYATPIVTFTLTNSDPQFAKKVLYAKVFEQVIGRGENRSISIVPDTLEAENLKMHPMMADTRYYQTLLERMEIFLKSALDDVTMREIVMYYQIYLDPVVVTSVEHYLWICPQNALSCAAMMAGFPTGIALQKCQIEQNFGKPITKAGVIKAILTASGITNCLPPFEDAVFLLHNLSKNGDKEWHTKVLPMTW
jgi:hypothetical protein